MPFALCCLSLEGNNAAKEYQIHSHSKMTVHIATTYFLIKELYLKERIKRFQVLIKICSMTNSSLCQFCFFWLLTIYK